jgi:hypothetical protein
MFFDSSYIHDSKSMVSFMVASFEILIIVKGYIKLHIHVTISFYQVKVCLKVINTHLYIIQKETN